MEDRLKIFTISDSSLLGGCYVVPTGDDELWVLSNFWITPTARGVGWASKLMEAVIAWADERGIGLFLNCSPYGDAPGLDAVSLEAFYARRDFAWHDDWELLLRPIKNKLFEGTL